MSESTQVLTLYMHCNVSAMQGNFTGNNFLKGFSTVKTLAWLVSRRNSSFGNMKTLHKAI